MTQSLERSQALAWVDLQDLLDKVDELKDLSSQVNVVHESSIRVRIIKLLLQLQDVPLLKQLSEVQEGMVPERDFDGVVLVFGYLCHQKLLEVLEIITLLFVVEKEEFVSVDRVENHLLRWQSAELHDLEKLIVVVLAWEDRRLDEELDGCAAQRPHVNALVIGRSVVLVEASLHQVWNESAKQHLRSSVVPRLDVSVHLVTLEGTTPEVYEFDREPILLDHDVFWLQVTVDQVCIPTGNKSFKDLPQVLSDPIQWQTSFSVGHDVVE
jgi:hypothetical protein